jgi:hypothetical protein
MPGTENIHVAFHWRLRDYVARDGVIDAEERALLAEHDRICRRTQAAVGLLARAGGIPRDLRRADPDLAALAAATGD